MKCSDCKNGKIFGLFPLWTENVPKGKRKLFTQITCPRCRGTMEVPEEMKEWVQQGAILRDRRITKQMTLRDACRKLDMDCVILSNMESGIIEPDMTIQYR